MSKDGMNYAPKGDVKRVVEPGQFIFAATNLDHGHIYGMCNGLVEAGGELRWVYDGDPARAEAFAQKYPGVKIASSLETILEDAEVQLVAAAAITSLRGPLGVRIMRSGKHYFTDKAPFTTLEQLEEARVAANETGKKYAVYYSERLHVESAIHAGELIRQGAIGRVVQVMGLGPHRLNAPSRPDWFFKKEQYGGILCDIGSHQVEQFLYFTGNTEAKVVNSKVANYAAKDYPELEDFGDMTLVGENGATGYFRVDWLTPNGLGTWGDGRTLILGTEGYIELRKYIDVGRESEGDQLYLVNGEGEQHMRLRGKVGFPYFGELILDILNGTENAMSQEHTFKAAELSLIAQRDAVRVEG
ncbi:Gfo/Idh/MocA family protein [Paenibacillus sp. PAMC21692]|jgi:predicted dehydrogenase|uniref:Gfo/Idh/MocA family protein n=1 Tax=Paenibacillus sp. PAMC21692 TaxID=2762320 RepID=UPI00164DEB39|nr:Gfo/Idh/MocA family oxidoreductase [Paenibacillus sp. PAMC21692]QNK59777.1 Gfo/Idh/MocA family oxidoreductase [Paenibacillus sp. PAMC21692]